MALGQVAGDAEGADAVRPVGTEGGGVGPGEGVAKGQARVLVLRQGEVGAGAGEGLARHDDLAVGLHRHAEGSVAAAGEVGDDLAGAGGAEAGVEAAVGVVPRQGEVGAGAGEGFARHDDLAVGLHRHAVGSVAAAGEVGDDLAGAGGAEGGVEAAVGVVPRQGEVGAGAGEGFARHDDLAVGLHRHAPGRVAAAGEVGDDLAGAGGAEAGVEAAVGVVPRQGEVGAGAGEGIARHDDLAVGLHRHAEGSLGAAGEVGDDLAGAGGAEAGVEGAVGVVPRQGEVVGRAVEGFAYHDDLAVGLHRHAVGSVAAAGEVGDDLAGAGGAEGGVEAAVGVVPRQGEVGAGAGEGLARHDDLAVGLHRHAVGSVAAAGEVGDDLAGAGGAEGGVEAAVGVVPRQGEVGAGAGEGLARHDDLAVGLHRHAVGSVAAAGEVGDDLAGAGGAEGRV